MDARISSRCGRSGSSASCARPLPEDAFIVTDVGWNKNGVGQQFPITVPGTFITPSGLATMGFGAGGGARRQDGAAAIAPRSRSSATAASAPNPSVIATAMEADLHVVWVVMDNSAFGTIAGLEEMHYGTTFGCVFERDGKPYRVDYAAMARGVRRPRRDGRLPPTSSGRRCARRSPPIGRR